MRGLIAGSIGLAVVILTAHFALGGLWGWVLAIALMGLCWLAEPWHGARWVSTVALFFFAAVSALASVWVLPAFWSLSSLVFVLVAWDLDHFAHYLGDVADVRNESELLRRHLRRLGLVAGLGWFSAVVTLRVRVTFDFVGALALGLLVIISLSGAIRQIRRESD